MAMFNRNIQPSDIAFARINNQFALFGTDPALLVEDDVAVFIEQIVPVTGSYVIKNKAGTARSGSAPTALNLGCGPMRLDGGFTITGSIALVKGFTMNVGK